MTNSPSPADSAAWIHDDIVAGEVRLHVLRAGSGRPVVLLHGFPEFWFSWRYQIPALAAAGYAVVAPDMRGYNTSEKPHGLAAYGIDRLVADVVALVDGLGDGPALLVGHDWGGIVAWYAAMRHPERFEKLVVLNAPHPATYARDFWTTSQGLRSFYWLLFQFPWLPEALIRSRNWRVIEEMFRREVFNADAFAHGEIGRYKEALARPGALTSMVNYYRAVFRHARRVGISDVKPIEVPTLLLWGERDPHLCPSLASGLEPWVKDLTVRRVSGAGHWIQMDEPELVTNAMLEFFSAARPA